VLGEIAQLDFLSFKVSRTVTSLWDLPNPFVERIDLNFLASSCSVRDIAIAALILFIQQKKSITSCCETQQTSDDTTMEPKWRGGTEKTVMLTDVIVILPNQVFRVIVVFISNDAAAVPASTIGGCKPALTNFQILFIPSIIA
jgi:hypothetical protein